MCEFRFIHLIAVWPWLSHIPSKFLNFLICRGSWFLLTSIIYHVGKLPWCHGSLHGHYPASWYFPPKAMEQSHSLTKLRLSNHMHYKISLKHIEARGKILSLWERVWTGWKDHTVQILGRLCSSVPSLSLCHITLPHGWLATGPELRFGLRAYSWKVPQLRTHTALAEMKRQEHQPLVVACQLADWTAMSCGHELAEDTWRQNGCH